MDNSDVQVTRLERPLHHGDGRQRILPTAPENSIWARLFEDTQVSILAHLGGEGMVSELQRLAVRRIAGFEVELIFLESKFAKLRHAGKQPDREDLALYNALANGQRRFCSDIGWKRVPIDIEPSLEKYLSSIQD